MAAWEAALDEIANARETSRARSMRTLGMPMRQRWREIVDINNSSSFIVYREEFFFWLKRSRNRCLTGYEKVKIG